MNRNIVTRADVARTLPPEPAGPPQRSQLPTGEGAPKPPDPDSWYQRLLKYIPGEAVGLYLFLDNLCKSQFRPPDPAGYASKSAEELAAAIAAVNDKQQPWLLVALAVALLFNWVYLWRVWKVRRFSQRLISCAALAVYVFAIGGVFATFPNFYSPSLGMAVLAVGAAFLAFIDPPGPPASPNPGGPPA